MNATRIAAVAALCSVTAAVLPLAIVAWQSRADLRGAITGARLIADRTAELVGETDVDARGERFTIARLVKTSDGTVLLVRPVLRESAATVAEARKPLSEAAETIRAARPVLGAARDALVAVPGGVEAAAGAVVELRGDVGAVLKNANDSWNDLYWDVKAGVESGTVAARGIAEASEAVGKAAPVTTQNIQALTGHAAGIAEDAHKVTAKFTAPQPWYKRAWGVVLLAGKVITWF